MNQNSSIKSQIFVPIITVFAVISIGIYFFISTQVKQNIIDQSIFSAKSTVQQYKTLRKYYAQNVVGKVKKNSAGKVKINFDHKEKSNTIPLPATMIHDMGALVSQQKGGIKLKLYSDFPFPNRANRVLDEFSQNAMQTFRDGKVDQAVVRVEEYEGKESVRVAVVDFLVAPGCVNCHNTRADTPKNDWKLGDVRGSLEVIVPVEEQLAAASMLTVEIAVAILFLGISILGIIYFYFGKVVIKPLNSLQNGLDGFFKYLNKDTTSVEPITISKNDEIGVMASVINDNISNTTKSIDIDTQFIEEVKDIVQEVKQGTLDGKLHNKVDSKNLEDLRSNFNEMLENMKNNVDSDINKIITVLESYQQFNFTAKVENPVGKVGIGVAQLGDFFNSMLRDNLLNGLNLKDSATVLIDNVEVLNTNFMTQSASLEESAAAIEEITNSITTTSNDIVTMSEYTKELSQSIINGQKLATATVNSMDEINEQTQAIADAITVIDQIAFQTNILSLNAAVEAATAGEAGKGFAVVAQEVRNLASRSADAAREIKNLVENATVKTNTGKESADKMINGYNLLNENIEKTTKVISGIDEASQDQKSRIEQINNAISSLDQATQQNSAIVLETTDIAKETNRISNVIVEDLTKTDFEGKDSVNKRRKNLDLEYPGDEKRTLEKSIKAVNKYEDKFLHQIEENNNKEKETPIKNEKIKAKKDSDNDEWESF